MAASSEIKPFKVQIEFTTSCNCPELILPQVQIPDSDLSWLQDRLLTARLPNSLQSSEWTESRSNGVSPEFLSAARDYWLSSYSWSQRQDQLNTVPQYKTAISMSDLGFGTIDLHFIHSSATSETKATPLLFLHGWPGSILEVQAALPLLNKAGFTLVAPSLPGFGWSSYTTAKGFKLYHHGIVFHRLMQKLGYNSYFVQGGDWGAQIAQGMGIMFPDSILGAHFNYFDIPEPEWESLGLKKPDENEYTAYEKQQIANCNHWIENDIDYTRIQNSKTLTLGVGLNDSPMAMLAWMADKLFCWADTEYRRRNYNCGDPNGSNKKVWSLDEIITFTMMHLFAGSSGDLSNDAGPIAGLVIYRENNIWGITTPSKELIPEKKGDLSLVEKQDDYIPVKVGCSCMPREVEMLPRKWVETKANVVWWREHGEEAGGGHFAVYEKPELLVRDIIEFVRYVEGSK